MCFGLPGICLRLDAFVAAMITLIVNLGYYTTEIVRAGIDSVSRGQLDAGTALGLTRLQVFFLIVPKSALQTMFPALASQFTLLMLSTGILSQIGVTDLFHMASPIDSATYRSFEVYAVVCGCYLALAVAFAIAPARADLKDILDKGVIRIGTQMDTPPFGYMGPDGKPTGFDVELGQMVGKALGVKVQLEKIIGTNRIPYLLTNKSNLVISAMAPARSAQRR